MSIIDLTDCLVLVGLMFSATVVTGSLFIFAGWVVHITTNYFFRRLTEAYGLNVVNTYIKKAHREGELEVEEQP